MNKGIKVLIGAFSIVGILFSAAVAGLLGIAYRVNEWRKRFFGQLSKEDWAAIQEESMRWSL